MNVSTTFLQWAGECLLGLGRPDWKLASCRFNDDGSYRITGSVTKQVNGERKWSSPLDKLTLSPEMVTQLVARYGAETGNCWRCMGTAKVLCRWSREGGSEFGCCDLCGGSGKAVAS